MKYLDAYRQAGIWCRIYDLPSHPARRSEILSKLSAQFPGISRRRLSWVLEAAASRQTDPPPRIVRGGIF